MSGDLWELPEGWVWSRFGDVAEVASDLRDPTKSPEAVHIAPNHIESGTGRLLSRGTVAGDDVKSAKHAFHSGQILYSKIRPYLAKVVLVDFEGLCSADVYPVSVMPGKLDARYLHRWLVSPSFTEVASESQGRTVLPKINQDALNEKPVPVAPLNEQRRIVAKLEDLLARSRRAKDALEAIPPLLEKLRQSILASAFRGDLTADWRAKNPDVESAEDLLKRIRVERRKKWEEAELAKLGAKGKAPTDDRWKEKYQEPEPVDTEGLPELPEGWCWAAWREVGFSQNGRAFPSSEYSDVGVPLLRPGNLHVSGIVAWTADNTKCLDDSWANTFPGHVVRENELVINLTAQSLKDEFLGRICMTGPGERCLLNQRIGRLTPVLVEPRFLFWQFKSPAFRTFVDGLNAGSLIQHMFTSQIDGYAVCIPPILEQVEIAKRLDIAASAWLGVQEKVETLGSTFSSVNDAALAKGFRGELVEQDPNDEPANVMLERLALASGAEGRTTNSAKTRARQDR